MAKKIRLTRPELKRQRDMLGRYERYLPMLKLKQQQLQVTVREVAHRIRTAEQALTAARARFASYQAVLAHRAGVDVPDLSVHVAMVVPPTSGCVWSIHFAYDGARGIACDAISGLSSARLAVSYELSATDDHAITPPP